jgi:hypothetical protein
MSQCAFLGEALRRVNLVDAGQDSVVLADDDYTTYPLDRPGMDDLVRTILRSHTVLFLGFGLQDPNFQRLFGQLRYIPRRYTHPSYAVFIDESKVLLDYWCHRGINVISLKGESNPTGGSDRSAQLLQVVNELARRTASYARNPRDRVHLLIRELAETQQRGGFDCTLRIRAPFGPFGSPDPNTSFVFSLKRTTNLQRRFSMILMNALFA